MAFLKDEEKKLLLDRYLDIEWPNDVDDIRCVRCQRMVINHHVSNCKHLFCDNCRTVFSDGRQWNCPQCNEYVTKLNGHAFDVELKIHKLRIFCPNKKYGCKYEDQLKNIPKHLMTCVDTLEAALPVESTGTNTMDTVVNQLAQIIGAIGELEKGFSKKGMKIDDMNSKLNLWKERVNGMGKKLEELELTSPKYKKEFQLMRLQLKTVTKRVEHYGLSIRKWMTQMSLDVQEMRNMIVSMAQKMDALKLKKFVKFHPLTAETYEWTIKDVAKAIQNEKWIFQSDAFKFTGYNYEIRAMLVKQRRHAYICLQFKEGHDFNQFLNKNGFTTVDYIFKDQSEILIKQHLIHKIDLKFYESIGQCRWVYRVALSPAIFSSRYVKNDCIKITISFEPASIDHSYISNNGVLKRKIDNYEMRMNERWHHNYFDPTFYTSPQGFRVTTKLDKSDEGTIEVKINFLTGEHDDSLSLYFPHKSTVTLINQLDQSKNLVKFVQCEEAKMDSIQFKSITFNKESGFVRDNSLIYSVVIEPVMDRSLITAMISLTPFFIFLYIMFSIVYKLLYKLVHVIKTFLAAIHRVITKRS